MTALALVESHQPAYADAIDRALVALGEAEGSLEIYPVATSIDAMKKAMAAFDVSAEVKRRSDALYVRALYALGESLRQEFPGLGDQKIAAETGFKLTVVRTAISISRPEGKPLEAYIDHLQEQGWAATISTLYSISVLINGRRKYAEGHPPSVAQTLSAATRYADASLGLLHDAISMGPDRQDKAHLRALRTSISIAVESIDLMLAGDRPGALSVLGKK